MSLLCGVGQAVMEFPDGLGLLGYGPVAGAGYNSADAHPLHARVMLLEDATDEEAPLRIYLCFVELMGGSPIVTRQLIEALRAGAQKPEAIGEHNVLIMPSHTHSGPGHYLGYRLSDVLCQAPFGHREDVVAIIVGALTRACQEAERTRVAADVYIDRRSAFGLGRNRSIEAFRANFDHRARWPRTKPGYRFVAGRVPEAPEASAIDPIFWTLWAYPRGEKGRAIGTFAVIGVHNASVGRDLHAYHPDWAGLAACAMQDHAGWAAVAMGAAGDVTAIPVGQTMNVMGLTLARSVAAKVVRRWVRFNPEDRAPETSLAVGFYRWRPRDDGLMSWDVGAPLLVGCEESRTPFLFDPDRGEARVASAAMRGVQRLIAHVKGKVLPDAAQSEDEQLPKQPLFGAAQLVLRQVLGLADAESHPLHLVRIGKHLFYALPTEVTTYAAWTLEQALRDRRPAGVRTISPLAMVNDYLGYLTTPAEYCTQNYEGAMTLYGQRSLAAISAALARIIAPDGSLRLDTKAACALPEPLHQRDAMALVERWAGRGSWLARTLMTQLDRALAASGRRAGRLARSGVKRVVDLAKES